MIYSKLGESIEKEMETVMCSINLLFIDSQGTFDSFYTGHRTHVLIGPYVWSFIFAKTNSGFNAFLVVIVGKHVFFTERFHNKIFTLFTCYIFHMILQFW